VGRSRSAVLLPDQPGRRETQPPVGPLLGRYPGDRYDGDTDALIGDHPWAISTANFAELYYRLAHEIGASGVVPQDPLAAPFLALVDVTSATAPADIVTALRAGGDRMLRADLPQQPPRAQRAVRRLLRVREERQQPLLELRRVPLRRAGP
jgi:hypothetical protein